MKISVQRRMATKISLFFNLEILLVLLFILPPMIMYLNNLLRGFMFTWPIFGAWLLVITFKKNYYLDFIKNLYSRKFVFLFLFFFIGVVTYNYLFVFTSQRGFQYVVTFVNILFLLVIDTYYTVKPSKYRLSLLYFIILSLGIQAAISIPYLLSADFYVVRLFASGQLDENQSLEAIKNGVGNNGLYSSIGAISILGLSVVNKFKGLYAKILLVSIASIIISIFLSTFFASIILFITGILVLLFRFYHKIFNPKVLFTIVFSVLASIIFYDRYLSKTRLLEPVGKRLSSFIEEQKDVTGRTDLAQVSVNTFKDNPFWGVGVPELGSYDVVGEHMPWVDYFAHFGFFGFLPFILFLFLLIKNVYIYYHLSDSFFFYRTACFIGLIIFFLSNFISPMITVPSMYMVLILFYASGGLKSI